MNMNRNRGMEEEANATRYWCHMCSQTVNAVVMEEEIKCTLCRSGFIEEMDEDHHHSSSDGNDRRRATNNASILAPILMEMINNSSSSSATRNLSAETLNEIIRNNNNRPRSVSVVQLLHGVRPLEPESSDDNNNNNNNNDGADGERERGRMIFIDPHRQFIAIPSSLVRDSIPAGSSLSDYFIGPGFEALLQRLAENDPNRYGTPPARKEDVESLATVRIEDPCLQCSVCLDDFEVGIEAKQMPCKHSFHADCLLPWLELHSSCPVCRYQLPTADETNKTTDEETNDNSEVSESSATGSSQGTENSDANSHEGEEENDDGNRNAFSIPWPFSSFISSLFSQDRNSSN